jgi:hypothetical protein
MLLFRLCHAPGLGLGCSRGLEQRVPRGPCGIDDGAARVLCYGGKLKRAPPYCRYWPAHSSI